MTYHDLDRPSEAVAVLREIGNRAQEADAPHFLAAAYRQLGPLAEALTCIQGPLAIAREDSRHAWGAFWRLELARIQRALGQPAEALVSYQEAASVHRRLGDRSREAMALDGTGEAFRELDRPDEAAPFHLLAASAHRELNDRWNWQRRSPVSPLLRTRLDARKMRGHRRRISRIPRRSGCANVWRG